MIKVIFKNLLDYIFFSKCPFCGEFGEDNNLCYNCYSKLIFINMSCIKCQQPMSVFSNTINICNNCLEDHDFYSEMIVPLVYTNFLKINILDFKNGNKLYLADIFTKFIYNKAKHLIKENSIITPVPLHNEKLYKRGYNQSLILAKSFANKANIICIPDLIIRNRNTLTQANKTAKEREENVKGAFTLNNRYNIENQNIFIIDDIITTGATIFEVAKIFKNIKVNNIYLLSIARRIKSIN